MKRPIATAAAGTSRHVTHSPLLWLWALQVGHGPHLFTFDHVFGDCAEAPSSLYQRCVAPLVVGLFSGYNGMLRRQCRPLGAGFLHTCSLLAGCTMPSAGADMRRL